MKTKYYPKSNVPPIILLRDGKTPVEEVTKVGVIPFIPHADSALWQVMVMKPHPEQGHPGAAPEYQIAKGTRRINMGGGWCDMRDDDLKNADSMFYENLADTALREGREEIGLKKNNIVRLFDVDVFSITSAKRNIRKALHVFAAEIKNPTNFGAFEEKTAEALWMLPSRFSQEGRADHVLVMEAVLQRLAGVIRND